MKSHRKRNILLVTSVLACVLLVVVGIISRRTTAADRAWVLTATSIRLGDNSGVLSGAALQELLSKYNTKSQSEHSSWTCTLSRRSGRITVDGKEYPVHFVYDKFNWNVLEVEARGKTIRLYSNTAEDTLSNTTLSAAR
jgi:hypothetical protein